MTPNQALKKVMEGLTKDVRVGLPWKLLYGDDLVSMAECIEELKEKVTRWREYMEAKGLRMNTGKTNVMVSGKNKGHVEMFGKLPCTVCGKGTVSNSRSTRGAQKLRAHWPGSRTHLCARCVKDQRTRRTMMQMYA